MATTSSAGSTTHEGEGMVSSLISRTCDSMPFSAVTIPHTQSVSLVTNSVPYTAVAVEQSVEKNVYIPNSDDEDDKDSIQPFKVMKNSVFDASNSSDEVVVENSVCDVSDLSDESCPLFSMDVESLVLEGTDRRSKRKLPSDRKAKKIKKAKQDRPIPNAFIALPIKSLGMRDQIEQLHHHMLQKDPKLKPLLIPLNRLHITLMVLKLDTQQDIDRARDLLAHSCFVIQEVLQGQDLTLEFSHLASFGSRVLYVDVSNESNILLKKIAGQVRQLFEDNGVHSTDKRQFTAHMTVAKVSRDRRRSVKQLTEDIYSDWEGNFGQESIKELELLSMTKCDETGYYHCFARESFVSST